MQEWVYFIPYIFQDEDDTEQEIHEEIIEDQNGEVEVIDTQEELVQDEKEEVKDKSEGIKIEVVEQPMMVSEVNIQLSVECNPLYIPSPEKITVHRQFEINNSVIATVALQGVSVVLHVHSFFPYSLRLALAV